MDVYKLNPEDIGTITTLTPIQEGILYHSLAQAEQNIYLTQLTFTVNTAIDADRFIRSWLKTSENHDVLRCFSMRSAD